MVECPQNPSCFVRAYDPLYMSEHALSEEGEIKNTVATACDDSEISVEEVKIKNGPLTITIEVNIIFINCS